MEANEKLTHGHRAMMLQHAKRLLGNNLEHLAAYRKTMLAGATGSNDSDALEPVLRETEAGEDPNMLRDALVLGDVTISQPTPAAAPTPAAPTAGLSTGAKLAAAAAIAAALGAPIGTGLLLRPAADPPAASAPNGTDTVVDIFAGRPQED